MVADKKEPSEAEVTDLDIERGKRDGAIAVVALEHPISRGNTTIGEVTLRKPKAGELRGLKLMGLIQMDFDSIEALIPRISQPTLTSHEVAEMDPADFTALATEIVSFLAPAEKISGSPTR